VIHIVTSKNEPPLHIELNEAWVLHGGPEAADARGQFRLEGAQTFYYPDRRRLWEATYRHGRKIGTETYWDDGGHKQWERNYQPDGAWSWKIFDRSGRVTAESRWKGKDLLDANPQGPLPQ
jgi:hypothetical protein